MKKKVKEFIEQAEPRTSDEFIAFYIIDSEKLYNGLFGKNGFNNIVLIGRTPPIDGKSHYELITDYSDAIHFYNGCGTANIEISHDNGIVCLWFTTPVKLSGEPLSSCIFEGKCRRVL